MDGRSFRHRAAHETNPWNLHCGRARSQPLSQIQRPARALRDFHKRNFAIAPMNYISRLRKNRMNSRKTACSAGFAQEPGFTSAHSSLQGPVNGLHSIDLKGHTNVFFRLTRKIEGVKHNCSLTVSEVFPVGAASGGQARSPTADCQSANAGEVGQPTNPAYRAPAE